jgi:hypothetical protein
VCFCRNIGQNNVGITGAEILHMTKGDSDAGWVPDENAISLRDQRAVQTLLSALASISDLRERPIPLAFVVVFLAVVLEEGRTVGDYATELNMSRFAAFKYIQSIGDSGRHNAPGLGLVTMEKGYRAKTDVVLTDKGRAVAARVLDRLRGRATKSG